MLRLRAVILSLLSLFACDTEKRGVAGATCRASSDCAGELQCIKATCVELKAAAPKDTSGTSPALVAQAQSAMPARPTNPAPSEHPIVVPPPVSAPASAPSTNDDAPEPPKGLPWLKPKSESDEPKHPPQSSGLGNLPPPGASRESGSPHSAPLSRERQTNSGSSSNAPDQADDTETPAAPLPVEPSDPFASEGGWQAALVNKNDPWASQVLERIQGFRVGTFGAESKSWRYSFQLSACPDGRFVVQTRRSSGDPVLDNAIKNALGSLQVPVSKPIHARMGGRCRRIAHEFTMKSQGHSTKVL